MICSTQRGFKWVRVEDETWELVIMLDEKTMQCMRMNGKLYSIPPQSGIRQRDFENAMVCMERCFGRLGNHYFVGRQETNENRGRQNC